MRRFAIYFAPSPDTDLHRLASAWLGRDAYTNGPVTQPAVPSLEPQCLDAITAAPRHYGFHATLTSPFELAASYRADEVHTAVGEWARRCQSFEFHLQPAELQSFLALQLTAPSAPMQQLHEDCVRQFHAFRMPPAPADLERRRRAHLTARQEKWLVTWGYPYVMEQFRFHMTLTDRLPPETRAHILAILRAHFAPTFNQPIRADAICVFEQSTRDRPFVITGRYPFGA